MTVTRKKRDLSSIRMEEIELLLPHELDHLVKEIGRIVVVLGTSANMFGILVRVVGSHYDIQQAQALIDNRKMI